MKKSFLILSLFCIASAFAQETVNKAAIISIFGDKQVTGGGLAFTVVLEKLAKDTTFALISSINKFEDKLNKSLLPEFPFPFLTKEEVVKNTDYSQLARENANGLMSLYLIPANDYHIITQTEKEKIRKAFEIYKDVDAVALCYLTFEIYDEVGAMGLSAQKVRAYVNMQMFNKEGKNIFKLRDWSKSNTSVMAVGGIMTDLDKIKKMVEEATDNLIIDMEKKLPKSLNKMAKKLAKAKK